jgi:hypothetical protein
VGNGKTATLPCSGKKALTAISINFGTAGAITYNGSTTEVEADKVATLQCAGKKMMGDVFVTVNEGGAVDGCITFSSPNSFTLYTAGNVKLWDGTLEYSTDGVAWNRWSGTNTLSSSASGKLYIRGTGNTQITGANSSTSKGRWRFTGSDISCSGNIENLLDFATVANGGHPTMAKYCFTNMFYSARAVITTPELPATTVTEGCYRYMFTDSGITTLPKLPATTLAKQCYYYMFGSCTKIMLSTTQEGEYQTAYRIPISGTGTTASDALSCMFRSTGGTFTDDYPSINKTYYTSNTLV